MCEADVKETARFVREFVTMSLIPWMEKCVVDWNEVVCSLDVLHPPSLTAFYSTRQIGDCQHDYFLPRENYLDHHTVLPPLSLPPHPLLRMVIPVHRVPFLQRAG